MLTFPQGSFSLHEGPCASHTNPVQRAILASFRQSGFPAAGCSTWCENRGNRWPLRDKLLLFVYFGFCLQATQCTAWFINSFWAACEVLTSPELTILAWCCPHCNPCSAPSPRITEIPVNPELFYFFPSQCKSLICINTSWTAWVLMQPRGSNTIQLSTLPNREIYDFCEWGCKLFLFQSNNGNEEKQTVLLK